LAPRDLDAAARSPLRSDFRLNALCLGAALRWGFASAVRVGRAALSAFFG